MFLDFLLYWNKFIINETSKAFISQTIIELKVELRYNNIVNNNDLDRCEVDLTWPDLAVNEIIWVVSCIKDGRQIHYCADWLWKQSADLIYEA